MVFKKVYERIYDNLFIKVFEKVFEKVFKKVCVRFFEAVRKIPIMGFGGYRRVSKMTVNRIRLRF